jgi:hypothetical protein
MKIEPLILNFGGVLMEIWRKEEGRLMGVFRNWECFVEEKERE